MDHRSFKLSTRESTSAEHGNEAAFFVQAVLATDPIPYLTDQLGRKKRSPDDELMEHLQDRIGDDPAWV